MTTTMLLLLLLVLPPLVQAAWGYRPTIREVKLHTVARRRTRARRKEDTHAKGRYKIPSMLAPRDAEAASPPQSRCPGRGARGATACRAPRGAPLRGGGRLTIWPVCVSLGVHQNESEQREHT